MGYEIHIERRNQRGERIPIEIAEWRTAIEDTAGVRLATGAQAFINPKTGEVIAIAGAEGDAELFLPNSNEWRRAFRWSPTGGIAFAAGAGLNQAKSPLSCVVRVLLHRLDAKLFTDDGEPYELPPQDK